MTKYTDMMHDYDPLVGICQKVANQSGAAAYIICKAGGQDRVIQSGMFTPIADKASVVAPMIRWACWPEGWRYER